MEVKQILKNVQRRRLNIPFGLQKMEDIFKQEKGKADVPHRHDYYTILFIEEAVGEHIIDFKTYSIQGPQIYFVSPGQVHQIVLTAKPKGWVFTFSKAFLVTNNIPESFISNINLFKPFGDSPPLTIDQQTFARLFRIVQDVENCITRGLNYQDRALGALLQLFLIYCSNSCTIDSTQLEEENTGICMFRDFKKLVDDKYIYWHKVSEYASEIHVSPKHLSSTVKKITGNSAKTIIHDRLLLESKRLLIHTDMSIKDIAYSIGFEEPLHFSSFFKKKVGLSPSFFRESKG